MKITVLIPTFNRPVFLADTLESMTRQTFKDFDVTVINDGGENVDDVIDRFSEKLKLQFINLSKSVEQPEALNLGLKKSDSSFVALCDDDDLFTPDHLEKLNHSLEENPSFSLTYGNVTSFTHDPKVPKKILREKFDKEKLLKTNFICTCAVFFRRSLYDKTGPFDKTLPGYWDWDFYLKALKWTDFLHVDEVVAHYRLHEGSHQVTQGDQKRQKQLDQLCHRHKLGQLPLKKLSDHFVKL